MKKTILALVSLLFVAACMGGATKGSMNNGNGNGNGNGNDNDNPDINAAAPTCDKAAIDSEIDDVASTLLTSEVNDLIRSLESKAEHCTKDEVLGALATYIVSKGYLRICPIATDCEPDAAAIVKAGLSNPTTLSTADIKMTIQNIVYNGYKALPPCSKGILCLACPSIAACGH